MKLDTSLDLALNVRLKPKSCKSQMRAALSTIWRFWLVFCLLHTRGYLCAFLWNMSLFYAIIWSSSWYACFVNLRFYFTSIFVSLFDSMKYDDKKNPDDVSSGCDICFAGALVTFHAMTLTHCAYVSISMSACAHNLWNFSICPSFTFWNHSHFIHGIVDMKL